MTIATKQIDCPRCKGYVVIPILSATERSYVGEELRKLPSPVSWIKHLIEWSVLNLSDSKQFSFHFSSTKGKCSRCKQDLPEHLPELEHVICTHCQSLNLDW